MSLFGKQDERSPSPVAGEGTYGITDLIRLLKIIPTTDHDSQLVVQVIRTTLESVGVKSSFVIDDALAQERGMRDAIEMLESQLAVLRQEIDARQDEIARLDVALRESMAARNLLASAEMPSHARPDIDLNQAQLVEPSNPAALDQGGVDAEVLAREPRSLPPPLPPSHRKAAMGRRLEPAQDR